MSGRHTYRWSCAWAAVLLAAGIAVTVAGKRPEVVEIEDDPLPLARMWAEPESPVATGGLPVSDCPSSAEGGSSPDKGSREAPVFTGDEFKITHYCICRKCCGKDADHPDYGVTASGRKARPWLSAAVDPDVIPLGSWMLVWLNDKPLLLRADDTGSGVAGAHLDICVEDHETALELGVKTARVYVLDEEEMKDGGLLP